MLKTNRLQIREITINDLDSVHALHSMPETDQYNTLGIPDNIEQTRIIVSNWLAANAEQPTKRYTFYIENDNHDFIGLIGVIMGKPNYRNAEIWYKLHSSYWNRGFATEAVAAILDFCFSELKLHRIEAGCATGNAGSIKVLEKAGFLREGHKRKLLPIRGEWHDNYFYAILDEDYFISADNSL
jgi:ribosomal-protein-alanine N-acetyltransferase